jgi:threonine dehydrogenase-like Zn-dependent dehydrogenase
VQVLCAPLVQYFKAHFTGDSPFKNPVPLVPGSNAICRVHEVGNDATVLQKGDLVILDATITARDDPSSQMLLGFMPGITPGAYKLADNPWRDGVWAQYARVPTENVYKVNEQRLTKELRYSISDLSLIQTCAVAMGGLADAGLKPGDTLVVAPATGRFSGATVLLALVMGANVVAAGRRQEALDELVAGMKENAASLKTVLLTGDVAKDTESFQEVVGPQGADVYVDWSPSAVSGTFAYFAAGISSLRHCGTVILMGAIAGEISIPYVQVMLKKLIMRGRFMYGREQLLQVIKLAENGKLPLGKRCGMETVAEFGLEKLEEALDEASSIRARAVLLILCQTK